MSYVITCYTNAVTPRQEFYPTKKEAAKVMAELVKDCAKGYRGSGYRKVGSVKGGRVSFTHQVFGVDTLITLKDN